MIYYYCHQTFCIKWNIWTPRPSHFDCQNHDNQLLSLFNFIFQRDSLIQGLKNIQNKLLNHNENFQEFRIRCDISTLYLLF
jgi:hypothetical protein